MKFLKSSYFLSILTVLMSVLLVTSCGDVGSEINGLDEILGVEEKDPVKEDDDKDEEEELQLLSGLFIDAAVGGVTYSSSVSGLTDNLGTFYYLAGDNVAFTIGGINLGSSTGQAQITPVDLVATKDLTDQRTVNILRLIQTLDDDGDPSNGITITAAVRTAAQNTTIDFNQPTTAFATSIASDIATITENRSAGQTTTLVSASSAVSHFAEVAASSATGGTASQITVTKNAPTAISLSASSVAENQTSGTTVGSLSGTDPDSGDELTFSLVSGTGDSGNSSFAISGTSLLTAASFDYETQTSYSIRIRATDLTGETYEAVFTVKVTDVDETVTVTNSTPTAISLSASSVAENESSGTTVGTLSTTDADSSDTHTYSLVSGSTNFSISGSTLLTAASFDYETTASYSITVRTTDSSGATFDQTLTVTVTDVNEAPTAVSLSSTSVTDPSSGTSVGTLSTTDVDSSDSHTYTITTQTLSGTSGTYFQISGSTLQGAATLSAGSYSVTVQSSDAGGLTTSQGYTITVSTPRWVLYAASTSATTGNLGGYAAANTTCNDSSLKPGSNTGYAFASFDTSTEIQDLPTLTGISSSLPVYGEDTTTRLAVDFTTLLDGSNWEAIHQSTSSYTVCCNWTFSTATGAFDSSHNCTAGTTTSGTGAYGTHDRVNNPLRFSTQNCNATDIGLLCITSQ